MRKYKRIEKKIKDIKENTSDKELFKILDDILEDNELNKVSGIERNSFVVQTRDYFKKYNRFSDKQRAAIIKTLKVYKDNLSRSNLV